LDMLWMNHLEEMEILRDSVRLRAYGQQDPLVEYKSEGHRMFQRLLDTIESNIVQTMLKVSLKPQSNPVENGSRPISAKENVNRNDPCPCGAKHPDGHPVKYKHCHGK
ncbi:MAG: preprotein translocase subunit SecA, partial [Candidatus Nealsonbacteria bacterium]